MPEKNNTKPEHQPETNLKKNSGLSRRRFLSQAATLALGGVASLSWLAACGETAANPTTAPVASGSTAPASTAAASIPTATSIPLTSTVPPTVAPTATPIPATATAAVAPTVTAVPAKPVNITIFGDIRTAGPKPPDVYYKLVEQAAKDNPDAVLLVGDIINAETSKVTVNKQWANFREATKPLASARWLPTIGNHDTNFMDWAEPLYLEAFKPDKLPDNGPQNYLGHAYSLDLGPVHLVTFASELPAHPHKIGKQQLAWLEKNLSSTTRPYTIVMSHDPAYPLGPHKGSSLDAYPDDRDALWQMLQKYKVSAYICGHEHLYFRSQRSGVTQIIAGTSGSNLYMGYGGGEFQFYTRLSATDNGLSFKVIDSKGKERDTFNL
jgi:hypothetical protein